MEHKTMTTNRDPLAASGKHVAIMPTPLGPWPLTAEQQAKNEGKTDREIADQCFHNGTAFIDPVAYAELLARRLSGPGMFEGDTYALIEQREAAE